MPRSKTPWEEDYWWPQGLLIDSGPVFILGGGPSLADVDLSLLRGHPVMALNSSAVACFHAGLEDQMLFFMDSGWWQRNRSICEAWRGEIFTCSRTAKREAPKLVKRIEMTSPAPEFPPPGAPYIRWGKSSGHLGISLAVAMGASNIILLGYDMRIIDGRSHHHPHYDRPVDPATYDLFLQHFEGWDSEARAVGVEIVNATPESALKEFRQVDLNDILNQGSGDAVSSAAGYSSARFDRLAEDC